MTQRNPSFLLTYNPRGGHWLARAAYTVLAAALVALAFFFITVALIAGALLAIIVAVRWWWILRRTRSAARTTGPLEGEYTVVGRSDSEGRR